MGGGCLEFSESGAEFVFELTDGEELLVKFLAQVINAAYHLGMDFKEVVIGKGSG